MCCHHITSRIHPIVQVLRCVIRVEEVHPLRISKVQLQFAVVVTDQVVLFECSAIFESELVSAECEFELSSGEEGGWRADCFGHI